MVHADLDRFRMRVKKAWMAGARNDFQFLSAFWDESLAC